MEDVFRVLFDEAPCYITIQDAELNIIEANRRFREDFGEFAGRKCFEVYKHRPEPCLECVVRQAFADGLVHHTEEVVSSRSGRKNVLVSAAPLPGPDGTISRVVEMSTDITSIRQLQGKLESIGLLISSISHGIKGLLTGLDGGRYLVNSGMQKNDPQRIQRGWAMVERNVERIRSQVLNILYYAKDRRLQLEPVAVSELLAEASEPITAKAQRHGIHFQLKEATGAGEIRADRNALRALLVNLLENSIDACRVDDKKQQHQVSLEAKRRGDHLLLVVSDNGIGMDAETRDKAFSLFYSSKGTEGTGLGLFIADKIARAHGGSIKIDSELGRGTSFLVKIPCRGPGGESPPTRR